MRHVSASAFGLGVLLLLAAQSPSQPAKADDHAKALKAARDKGLDWLTKNQAQNGSWGKTYTLAVTSFACLSYLGAADEPFDGAHGKALTKGLAFLLANQNDGMFAAQGHSWIHGQGFATLKISSGKLQLASVNASPFGVHPLLDPSIFQPQPMPHS